MQCRGDRRGGVRYTRCRTDAAMSRWCHAMSCAVGQSHTTAGCRYVVVTRYPVQISDVVVSMTMSRDVVRVSCHVIHKHICIL